MRHDSHPKIHGLPRCAKDCAAPCAGKQAAPTGAICPHTQCTSVLPPMWYNAHTHTSVGECVAQQALQVKAHTEHQHLPLRLLLLLLPMLVHTTQRLSRHMHTPFRRQQRRRHLATHTKRQTHPRLLKGFWAACVTPRRAGCSLAPRSRAQHTIYTHGRPHKPRSAAAADIYADISCCTPGANQYRNATAPQLP